MADEPQPLGLPWRVSGPAPYVPVCNILEAGADWYCMSKKRAPAHSAQEWSFEAARIDSSPLTQYLRKARAALAHKEQAKRTSTQREPAHQHRGKEDQAKEGVLANALQQHRSLAREVLHHDGQQEDDAQLEAGESPPLRSECKGEGGRNRQPGCPPQAAAGARVYGARQARAAARAKPPRAVYNPRHVRGYKPPNVASRIASAVHVDRAAHAAATAPQRERARARAEAAARAQRLLQQQQALELLASNTLGGGGSDHNQSRGASGAHMKWAAEGSGDGISGGGVGGGGGCKEGSLGGTPIGRSGVAFSVDAAFRPPWHSSPPTHPPSSPTITQPALTQLGPTPAPPPHGSTLARAAPAAMPTENVHTTTTQPALSQLGPAPAPPPHGPTLARAAPAATPTENAEAVGSSSSSGTPSLAQSILRTAAAHSANVRTNDSGSSSGTPSHTQSILHTAAAHSANAHTNDSGSSSGTPSHTRSILHTAATHRNAHTNDSGSSSGTPSLPQLILHTAAAHRNAHTNDSGSSSGRPSLAQSILHTALHMGSPVRSVTQDGPVHEHSPSPSPNTGSSGLTMSTRRTERASTVAVPLGAAPTAHNASSSSRHAAAAAAAALAAAATAAFRPGNTAAQPTSSSLTSTHAPRDTIPPPSPHTAPRPTNDDDDATNGREVSGQARAPGPFIPAPSAGSPPSPFHPTSPFIPTPPPSSSHARPPVHSVLSPSAISAAPPTPPSTVPPPSAGSPPSPFHPTSPFIPTPPPSSSHARPPIHSVLSPSAVPAPPTPSTVAAPSADSTPFPFHHTSPSIPTPSPSSSHVHAPTTTPLSMPLYAHSVHTPSAASAPPSTPPSRTHTHASQPTPLAWWLPAKPGTHESHPQPHPQPHQPNAPNPKLSAMPPFLNHQHEPAPLSRPPQGLQTSAAHTPFPLEDVTMSTPTTTNPNSQSQSASTSSTTPPGPLPPWAVTFLTRATGEALPPPDLYAHLYPLLLESARAHARTNTAPARTQHPQHAQHARHTQAHSLGTPTTSPQRQEATASMNAGVQQRPFAHPSQLGAFSPQAQHDAEKQSALERKRLLKGWVGDYGHLKGDVTMAEDRQPPSSHLGATPGLEDTASHKLPDLNQLWSTPLSELQRTLSPAKPAHNSTILSELQHTLSPAKPAHNSTILSELQRTLSPAKPAHNSTLFSELQHTLSLANTAHQHSAQQRTVAAHRDGSSSRSSSSVSTSRLDALLAPWRQHMAVEQEQQQQQQLLLLRMHEEQLNHHSASLPGVNEGPLQQLQQQQQPQQQPQPQQQQQQLEHFVPSNLHSSHQAQPPSATTPSSLQALLGMLSPHAPPAGSSTMHSSRLTPTLCTISDLHASATTVPAASAAPATESSSSGGSRVGSSRQDAASAAAAAAVPASSSRSRSRTSSSDHHAASAAAGHRKDVGRAVLHPGDPWLDVLRVFGLGGSSLQGCSGSSSSSSSGGGGGGGSGSSSGDNSSEGPLV